MAKGTAFSRTMDYFREAQLTEARAALAAASEIVHDRAEMAQAIEDGPRMRRSIRAAERIEKAILTPSEHTAMTASTKAIKEAEAAANA